MYLSGQAAKITMSTDNRNCIRIWILANQWVIRNGTIRYANNTPKKVCVWLIPFSHKSN
jgi:hypothetical protein